MPARFESATLAAPIDGQFHAGSQAPRYRLERKAAALPVVGDLLHLRADHLAFLDRCMRTGADIVQFDLGTRRGFAILHPDAVREILVHDNDAYVREGNLETRALSAFLGRGVLTTDGDAWLDYKRMNAPAFSRGAVAAMQGLVDDSIDRSFASWASSGRATRCLFDDFLRLSVTATTTGFLSLRPDDDEQDMLLGAMISGPEAIMTMARNAAPWLRHLPTPGNVQARRAVIAVEGLIRRNVERRRQQGSTATPDLLDMVLQYRHPVTGQPLSPLEVRDQLVTALVAAPENIATTLSWAAWALQANPSVLEELRASLARGEQDYLTAVIDETLRRHAATPMIDRTTARDVRIGGIDLPRGSLVMMPLLALHNHPRYWDAPETFRPERWLGAPTPRAWFAFGHGPRKCIGERLARVALESTLRRFVTGFDWSRPSESEPGYRPLINLRPRDRMRMEIVRRGAS